MISSTRVRSSPGSAALPQGPQDPLQLGDRQEHLPRRGDDPEGTLRREQGMLERQGRQVDQGECAGELASLARDDRNSSLFFAIAHFSHDDPPPSDAPTPGRTDDASRVRQEAKAELFEFSHPDPYCVPFMPGGSLFMRNPPPPLSICFPDGNYPDDAPRYTLNPDMSVCRPETGKSAVGSVLVDFGKKNME